METKRCPYCGEEIMPTAKKCRHCGEWLEESKEKEETTYSSVDDNEETSFPRFLGAILLGGIGFCCFHFGSWSIAFNTKISALEQILYKAENTSFIQFLYDVLTDKKSDFILNSHSILIRINDSYYGFVNTAAYFDSPILQWIMLGVAVVAFVEALKYVFNIA
jgi:hypothetical protein